MVGAAETTPTPSVKDGAGCLVEGGSYWSCAACTLINSASASRCSACESLRYAGSSKRDAATSGVVVVLPPPQATEEAAAISSFCARDETARKRAKLGALGGEGAVNAEQSAAWDEQRWSCPVCTLLNSPDDGRCDACGSLRWVLPHGASGDYARRVVAAAALRAARRPNEKPEVDAGRRRDVDEWATLPPAPEGHLDHCHAEDRELDMFAELTEKQDASVPEAARQQENVREEAAPVSIVGKSHVSEGPHDGLVDQDIFAETPGVSSLARAQENSEPERPAWGTGGVPLFGSTAAAAAGSCSDVHSDVGWEDAVARLTLLGFDPTKCHLALEAAGGDEHTAKDFLMREA
eukprot:TRINITY_DN71601_c0_g1_i1.p1 TRINITY_DN71601_c0_g1~~TRINITY_DN71601_c0_g1_i1.p1  ORF type:complete len:350 (-),score=79.95 TRINITY_DN71601_c0_g1_i1:28-1077(-)